MDAGDFVPVDPDAEGWRVLSKNLRDIARGDIRNDISEFVNFDDYAVDREGIFRFGPDGSEPCIIRDDRAEFLHFHTAAEPGRYRRKNVASVEGVAHRLPEEMLGGHLADFHALLALVNHREHAVVGRHKPVVFRLHENGAPFGAHAGIHYDDVDRARREDVIALGDAVGAVENIERIHLMVEVNNHGVGIDAEDHALHNAYEMVVFAKVRSD